MPCPFAICSTSLSVHGDNFMSYLRIRYIQRCILLISVVVISLCWRPWVLSAQNLPEAAQRSTLYLAFDVTDPETGAKKTIQGTGFVVSKSGYVLTAAHLFRDWRRERIVDRANNPRQASLGEKPSFVLGSPLNFEVVDAGDPDIEDIAVLKLPDPMTQPYPVAPICFSTASAAKPGDTLTSFGFPLDQNFQPIPVTLGTQNAPGGRWQATSAFTEGMSGGPIYSSDGVVVGLVKGGLDSDAVRWITPIEHASQYLGPWFHERCRPDIPISDIVISRFDGEGSDLKVSRQIETAIQQELRRTDLRSVSVTVTDKPVTQEVEAQEIINSSNAKAVIWGWRDATRINVRIAVAPVKEQYVANDNGIGTIDVFPEDRNLALVAANLQQAAKTTAFYVVGQLFYANNEYDSGRRAMDAAMNSLPDSKDVVIENKSLVEFLKGRQSFASGDLGTAATHYIAAIKYNAYNAAAYNNLAIVYARLDSLGWHEEDQNAQSTVEQAKKKMEPALQNSPLADLLSNSSSERVALFKKARALDSSSTAIYYNELASSWNEVHAGNSDQSGNEPTDQTTTYLTEAIDTGDWKRDLLNIIRADPTIPGAYVMLGAISFDNGLCSDALNYYKRAALLSPNVAEIHYDLGLSYFCAENYAAARSELESAALYIQKEKQSDDVINGRLRINLALSNTLLKLRDFIGAGDIIRASIRSKTAEQLQDQKDFALLSAVASFSRDELKNFGKALDQVHGYVSKQTQSDPEAMQTPPLDRLLAAWSLEMQGKQSDADKLLNSISAATEKWNPERDPSRSFLLRTSEPIALTWFDLMNRCADQRPISSWGKGGGCLPETPRERIQKILAMYQDRIALDIFYRVNVFYGGLACPYVYSREVHTNIWRFETPILVDLRSETLKAEDTRRLKKFDGDLLIAEREPETSFIDQIFVTVVQKDGKIIRLNPSDPISQPSEGKPLITLPQGHSRIIHFIDANKIVVDPIAYYVTAVGYYVPYKHYKQLAKWSRP